MTNGKRLCDRNSQTHCCATLSNRTRLYVRKYF